MISELGHFALIMAMAVAFVQAFAGLVGPWRHNEGLAAMAAPAALLQFALVSLSFAALTHAFVTSDFSVANVANNSHSLKPMLYKVSGVWGNHEGSMLMWALILALYGGAVAFFGGNLRPSLKVRVLGVQALIGIGILAFILFTSNPFERLNPAPIDGAGLNPLLQDPGLAFHPPLLYLGYVGLSTTFSFAVAALIEGRIDAAWARWVRPWTLAAWGFLTGGIALGSWWAYYELGWGGWWFWDPVENASFMPWLAATALLHSAIVSEKRDALKAWTVFLAIIAFALSMLGTFLVRSGVLTSVHAFASDPSRGVFILAFLVITVGAAFALYAWRGPSLVGQGRFDPISREGGLVVNNFLLTVAAASVLLGTLYPLFLDVLELGKVSVGAPYFNSVFIPMMIPAIILMGIAPLLQWKQSDGAKAVARLKYVFLIAVLVGFGFWLLFDRASALASFGMALAAWLALATLYEFASRVRLFEPGLAATWRRILRQPRASWGMTLAHGGLALAIAGMTASSAWRSESIQVMRPGETVTVSGYEFTLKGAKTIQGPNYQALTGAFQVKRGDGFLIDLFPEKRTYTVSRQPTTEAAIEPTFFGDLYAVIGDADGKGGYITRIYFNPLVPWMWAGALIMMLGAGVSLTDRRYRIGAPSARPVPKGAEAEA
ncbi:MAG: heme lyase CcmF/NrfE family subunit [Rhodospirillaceae bacterium]|jgi:cytochrome c-type biogenesis protein CcmF|nr:heme lyase CcmF/NrfE family subunit [Rhodospirillaceae bacterium]MBT4114961.1 heme lyase CcmF/NrfE family subunit [Rhodospirillaceae bacterium]MBT4750779.1 heme lyase CcmF/NrfE family subunit [Rhodospirillaceae bacterium]MBT5177873.1 heme lyase CcmF/NrfE family subunit [Rhodospirillaceae bacterium]MBT6290371.1 heme lyase CcmF/NrfE family subunit [Rhodospirillaceae bacterium]